MQLDSIKPGDKLTFQWRPGYRGPLRDGETVLVLEVSQQGIKVRYRLNQEDILQPEDLFRSVPSRK
jgi:hypothetical protein